MKKTIAAAAIAATFAVQAHAGDKKHGQNPHEDYSAPSHDVVVNAHAGHVNSQALNEVGELTKIKDSNFEAVGINQTISIEGANKVKVNTGVYGANARGENQINANGIKDTDFNAQALTNGVTVEGAQQVQVNNQIIHTSGTALNQIETPVLDNSEVNATSIGASTSITGAQQVQVNQGAHGVNNTATNSLGVSHIKNVNSVATSANSVITIKGPGE